MSTWSFEKHVIETSNIIKIKIKTEDFVDMTLFSVRVNNNYSM